MKQTQTLSEDQKKKLHEIANKLGTTVGALLETSTPEAVIENYSRENLQVLND